MEEAITWFFLTLAFAWMVSKLVAIVTDFQQGLLKITRSKEGTEVIEEGQEDLSCESKDAEAKAEERELAGSVDDVSVSRDEEWETTDPFLSTMDAAERTQVMEKEKARKGDNRKGMTKECPSTSAGVELNSPSTSVSLLDGSYCQVFGEGGEFFGAGPESRASSKSLKVEGDSASCPLLGESAAKPVVKDVESYSEDKKSTLEEGATQKEEVAELATEEPARATVGKSVDADDDDDDWEGVEAGELEEEFDAAATFVAAQAMGQGGMNVSQDIQLQLYALYKQATVGICSTPQPSAFNVTARTKWDVWRKLEKMEREEAMGRYIGMVALAFPDWNSSQDSRTTEDPDPALNPGGGKASHNKFGPVFSSLAAAAGEDEEQETRAPLLKLQESAQEGDLNRVLELLRSKAASVNDVDDEGCTALHLSADRGHVAVVAALIEAGSDVNAKDAFGQTPLHYACTCEYKDVAEALLKAGADPLAKDKEGSTPASICASFSWNLTEMGSATST